MAQKVALFTKEKIYKRLIIFSWLILIGFLLYCLLVAIIPFDIVTFDSVILSVENENKEVKAGDFVLLRAKGCKHFAIEANIVTHIEDTLVWHLPNTKSNLESGCFDRVLKIKIPTSIPTGETVRIHRELTYKISPFSTKTEIVNSEFFKIIK